MAFDSSESRFQRKLREELETAIEEKEAEVALGNCPDFSMYKDKCGYIRGLKDALRIAEKLGETFNRE